MKTKFHLCINIISLSLLFILTGCSMVNSNRYLTYKHEFLVRQGNPPGYVDGYVDGCSSGLRMAGDNSYKYKKDAERAERDALYAKGWNDGQICCRNEILLERQKKAQEEAQKKGQSYTSIEEQRNRRVQAESKAADAEMREIWDQLRK